MFGLRGNIVANGNILNNWILVIEDDHIYDVIRETDDTGGES